MGLGPGTRAVLFDIDGVLLHHGAHFYETLALAGRESPREAIGRFYSSGTNLRCDKGELDPELALAPFLAEMGFPGSAADYLAAQYAFEERFVDLALLEGVRELRASGLSCYVASNQNPRRKARLVEWLSVEESFDGAFFSCDLGHVKAEDGYWEAVLESLAAREGLAARDLLFLDDLPDNLRKAEEHGLSTRLIEGKEGILAFLAEARS